MLKRVIIYFMTICMFLNSFYCAAEAKTDQALRSELKMAIVDEIYSERMHGSFADVGESVQGNKRRINIYIKPILNDRNGWVVYKLMPVGEVYRMFSLSGDGGVLLYGDIDNEFPPTQPSYKTVYMSDEQLIEIKKTWTLDYIEISLSPGEDEIKKSIARQRNRLHTR